MPFLGNQCGSMKTLVVALLAITLVAGVAVPQSVPADLQLVARVIPSTNAHTN